MTPLLAGRGAAKEGEEAKTSGILIGTRLGVPMGEWKGLD
jgi:hypothetical protein